MILAVDVCYHGKTGYAISMTFKSWEDDQPFDIKYAEIKNVKAYVPGEFYKRELPCLRAVLRKNNLKMVKTILVDGYVVLDNNGKPGLGGHLYKALKGKIPVIGIAKNPFYSNTINVRKIYRGKSQKPLYITTSGTELDEAVSNVGKMKGNYRIPDLLRLLNRLTKEISDRYKTENNQY